MNQNILSEEELIQQAIVAFGPLPDDHIGAPIGDLGLALEEFYMNGAHNQQGGTVEWGMGHRYRVHRWVMFTDSHGHHELQTFDNEADAIRAMDRYDTQDDEIDEEE